MSVDDKLAVAGKRKDSGNALFKAGKWKRAVKKYKDAASVIEYEVAPTAPNLMMGKQGANCTA